MISHDEMYALMNNDFLYFSSCENRCGKLDAFIRDNFDWKDKTVLEAGVGMGRMTDKYIESAKQIYATDKSGEMLEYCRHKYERQKHKISFVQCDHTQLMQTFEKQRFDIFLSSYSLCYTAVNYKGAQLESLLDNIFSVDAHRSIIIESVGIFSQNDAHFSPYREYFNYLDEHFDHCLIDTDIVFADNKEAVYYSELFFGSQISRMVENSASNCVPEKTCIWFSKQ